MSLPELITIILALVLSPLVNAEAPPNFDASQFMQELNFLPSENLRDGNCARRSRFIRMALAAHNIPSKEIKIASCNSKSANTEPVEWLSFVSRTGYTFEFDHHVAASIIQHRKLMVLDPSASSQPLSLVNWLRNTNFRNVSARVQFNESSSYTDSMACKVDLKYENRFALYQFNEWELIGACNTLYNDLGRISLLTNAEVFRRRSLLINYSVFLLKFTSPPTIQINRSEQRLREECVTPIAYPLRLDH